VDPSASELYNYFVDRIRDNLHVCLCFSPVGQKFRDRFRKFPALFNECTIDWFLPWPEEALVSVASSFLSDFKELDTTSEIKAQLMKHMGNVHIMVTETCEHYYNRMRRQVYFTPKSYLSYLDAYKKLYLVKYKELDQQESNFRIGVNKINEASETINKMKI
jgi:dynein heavy chain